MSRRAIIAALAGGAVVTVGGTAYYAYTNARKGISGLLSVPASTPLMTFTDHTSYVWGVAWSPNGKYIASASADGTSHVWDVSTKQLMFSFRSDFRSDYQPTQNLPNDAAYSVAWLPDATGFAVGFADEYAEIFNLTTHQRAGYYDSKNDDNPNRIGILYAVSISPDGRSLALANFFNNDIQIFNVMQQSMTLDLPGHEDAVRSLAWSHNRQYLASGSDDMTVKIWDTSTGEMLFTYKKHTNAIRAVSWSPDDTRIVSNSENGPMYIWTWNSGQPSDSGQTLHTFENDEVAAAWSHNGKYIACSGSSGSDGKIQTHVRDAQSGSLLHAFPTGPITSVSWSPDDSRIVTANLVTVSGSTINKNIVQVWQI